MYRKYLFIYWVNSSGGNMSCSPSELFEHFKHSKHSEHVKPVEHFERVRLSRGRYELVVYKN